MKYNYHAITLDKKEIGETDRLYTFYTRENGLMRVSARSVRKSEAKLAAQVEDFVLTHITIVKNYGYGTLAGAVAEDYFDELHTNFTALTCVDRARKVFLTLIREHDADARVFDLLASYLQMVNDFAARSRNRDVQWITSAFLIKLFGLQGYVFDAKRCGICLGVPQKHVRHVFDIHSGGVVCNACAQGPHLCAADVDTIKSLRAIHDHALHRLGKIIVNDAVNRQLHAITVHIEQWIMR